MPLITYATVALLALALLSQMIKIDDIITVIIVQNAARLRWIESHQQFDQGCFASTGGSDKGDRFSPAHFK